MLRRILLFPFTLLSYIFGKFSWSRPPWLKSIVELVKNKPAYFYGFMFLAVTGFILWIYFDSLPKPVMARAAIENIQITPNYDNAVPDNLDIQFEYDFSALNQDQERPEGLPSVARIDLVGQEITQGIELSPAKRGKWRWIDDRQIQFVPETDWPAGTTYSISFDETLFLSGTILSTSSYAFSTPELSAEIISIEFYQDPQEPTVRRVISTLQFSHPIEKVSFEKNLSMSMRPSGENISADARSHDFSVTYDKNYREAYIQSEPVTLPSQSNYMTLTLQKGVGSILGGEETAGTISDKTLIPDIYSFLRVSSARADIIRNDKNDPEQVVMLEFTDDISQQELLSKISFYLLPTTGERNGRNYWRGPREINQNILADSREVLAKLVPNARSFSKLYSFKIDVPENRFLYIKINEGLNSVNHFVQRSFYDVVLRSPLYPKEIDITGEGSVLTYTGNHQLRLLARGVPAIKYTVGRLLKGQLYHLISQTSGDISDPNFNNWNFSPDNVAEYDTKIVDLRPLHPSQANYSSIDLTQYLTEDKNRFGLFFVEARAWDRKLKREIGNVSDRRLILVTDLGVIVKNNSDKSHDLFVQSITDGNPVSGAKVELLGRNGVVLFDGTTDREGHILFPSTRGLDREKSPTVYVVKTSDDLSFIPFDRRSRQINLSRFDIGGAVLARNGGASLNAFLFTDRGIYRPGDEVNVGTIVKTFDFSNVENIPLELVVRGPQGKELKVKKFKLPQKGFSEFQYFTDPASNTGNYSVSLHLVRDNRYRGPQIGRTAFKLEEFQPDTLKIENRLMDVVDIGWNTQELLKSKVTLTNLFGTPAQDRKVSARVIIQPQRFDFTQFRDYQFTDPHFDKDTKPLSLNTRLEDKRTDADGIVEFEIDLQKFQEGTYSLQVLAEGFDQAGGRSVVAASRTLISPLHTIIGYKPDGRLDYLKTGSRRIIEFIAIDKTLNRREVKDLKLRLIEIQKISTLVKQRNNTYKYQTVEKEVEISSDDLIVAVDGFEFTVDTQSPGDFAIEIIDEENLRLARLKYSVVGFANLAGKIDKNAQLQLKLDKQDYFPGDMIEMSLKAPYAGAGLITIESDKVHHFKWFKTLEESSVQHIRIPENLEGTGYVSVAFVRDVSSKEVFTSPLSYAVQPFAIDRSKRRVDIVLETKDIVRPGRPMEITFSTSRESKIAVFAVDEGILQVAKYQTPDPLSHFLKKRSLGVETLQILDLILPDFELVKQLSASGGGLGAMKKALAKNLNPFSRKNDKPAVYWSGIYAADEESRKVIFDVPDTFSGQLRVMAVAVSEESVGAASTSLLVRGPFVISPNVLTHAAPGDEFMVTVGVANIIEGSGKNAQIAVEVSSSEHLEILGVSSTVLSLDEGSEGKFTFRVRALPILGAAELIFTASHGNEQSSRTASLSIRAATTYYTSLESGFEDDGQVELTPKRILLADLAEQSVAASASPLVIVNGLTSYLETFPYGCTEQVVSQVFPLVGLMSHPAYGPYLRDVNAQFSHLIDKLRERQLGDGGFAFWPGQQNSAQYPSIYVMHFLIEASYLGYPVPPDMMQRGEAFLTAYVERPASSLGAARDRANAIYLLTLLGRVTTNYLIDLEENLNLNFKAFWKTDILASYMAATYKLLQKDQEANKLIDGYKLNSGKHNELNDFHSLLAIDAQHIYLLSKHFETKARDLDGDDIHQLTKKIFKGEFNTISSAYSILALGAYSKLVLSNDFDEKIEFKATDREGLLSTLNTSLQPFLVASYGVDTRDVTLRGEKPLYYLNVQSGFDADLPDKTLRQGIEIYRDFVDDEGNVVNTLEQGKDITVRLRVRALDGRSLKNIAVVDLLPGGFEIIRSSVSRKTFSWRADYVDIREDRIVFYGDFDSKVRELTYKVKLTAAGDFTIPPSYAESMYDRSLRAISKSGRFNVTTSQ